MCSSSSASTPSLSDRQNFRQPGLTDDEVAFFDALETNDSAVKVLGEPTLIKVHDDFEVAGVMVAIEEDAHASVESGPATFDPAVRAWRYVATADASAKPTVTVTANALDRPGHAGTLSLTQLGAEG